MIDAKTARQFADAPSCIMQNKHNLEEIAIRIDECIRISSIAHATCLKIVLAGFSPHERLELGSSIMSRGFKVFIGPYNDPSANINDTLLEITW